MLAAFSSSSSAISANNAAAATSSIPVKEFLFFFDLLEAHILLLLSRDLLLAFRFEGAVPIRLLFFFVAPPMQLFTADTAEVQESIIQHNKC